MSDAGFGEAAGGYRLSTWMGRSAFAVSVIFTWIPLAGAQDVTVPVEIAVDHSTGTAPLTVVFSATPQPDTATSAAFSHERGV